MDFGRTPTFATVPYTPPVLDPSLSGTPGVARVFLGCPVWTQKGWTGKVFPEGTPPGEFLFHYSRAFDSVELNSTFYQTPSWGMIERWRRSVPAGFLFCPKVPQAVSRATYWSNEAGRAARAFYEAIRGFGDALGPVFLQLPPQFGPGDLRLLSQMLQRPPGMPMAVEFRNPDFFRDRSVIEAARHVVRNAHASLVITDTPGRRDVCHGSVIGDRVFLRFAGNQMHPTDTLRVRQWVGLWQKWAQRGVQEIYFFAHQPEELTSPDLIEVMREAIAQVPELTLWKPEALQSRAPQLAWF